VGVMDLELRDKIVREMEYSHLKVIGFYGVGERVPLIIQLGYYANDIMALLEREYEPIKKKADREMVKKVSRKHRDRVAIKSNN
jgi:hypothetical protein